MIGAGLRPEPHTALASLWLPNEVATVIEYTIVFSSLTPVTTPRVVFYTFSTKTLKDSQRIRLH